MGNACQAAEEPGFQKAPQSTGTSFNRTGNIKQGQAERDLTQSTLVRSRTSNIKRWNGGLNDTVRSQLSQLPDISSLKRKNFDISERIYIDSLKANYCGDMTNGRPDGFGALEFDNGDYLEGDFVNGVCEGRGRYIKANGSYYEGDLKNNVADGHGKYFDRSGYRYEGQWKNNLPNGRGEAKYTNGSRYSGEFINNRRHGYGTLLERGCIF